MHEGEIMGIVDGKSASREEIGLMMAGKRQGQLEKEGVSIAVIPA